MNNLDTIRETIESHFSKITCNNTLSKVSAIEDDNTFGHSASSAIEEWTVDNLNKIDSNFKAYFPEEFLNELFSKIGKDKSKINNHLDSCWWSFWLGTQRYVKDFLNDKNLERRQQDGADILLFYGKNIQKDSNSVILINAKSHNMSRESRPPNIISCRRLLKDFKFLLNSSNYDLWSPLTNYWFISANWKIEEGTAFVKETHIRDLFKLDLVNSVGLTINFDAAIQLQCHVDSMIEIKQKKIHFMDSFSKKFIADWVKFVESRNKTRTALCLDIQKVIKSKDSD